jgi:hypothetical protein
MRYPDRSRLAAGLVLVLLGAWFLAVQFIPSLQLWSLGRLTWPLILVGVGVLIGITGLVLWTPPLLVPASIISGLGLLMYWQNLTGNWASWAYAWALIPGFVGVGVVLSGLMRGRVREAVTGGGWLMFISLLMFLIFGSFLGGPVLFGQFWPVLLILLGAVLLIRALFQPRSGPPPTVMRGA